MILLSKTSLPTILKESRICNIKPVIDGENYHKDERNDDEEKLDYESDEEEMTG